MNRHYSLRKGTYRHRYLTKDDPQKAPACLALFQKAQQNRVRLTTSESVIAETVYLLSSKKVYRLQPQEVKRRLAPLLHLRALRIEHKDTIITALDLYGAYHMDFEDCLTVAHMERQKLKEIYSYDQDFDQVEHIQRREP